MEIHIRLAGVQLGPYSEKQVREYLSEGLVSPTDSARTDGTDNWIPVSDLLSSLPPPVDHAGLQTAVMPASAQFPAAPTVPLSATEFVPDEEAVEAPKRAPDAPPGVSHLPSRNLESKNVSLSSETGAISKKTILLGPTAPTVPSRSGQVASFSTTTSPLTPLRQGTKKVPRSSLEKVLGPKTAPLPSRPIPAPSAPPSPPAQPASDASTPIPTDPKKAPLPSLLRSLTAKTVPMRSSAAPPLGSSTVPVTAPLPATSVFKPTSGTVPPPSVVNALTKKLGKTPMPDGPTRPQTHPPTLGLPVETNKIAPLHLKAPEKSAASIPPDLDEELIPPPPRKRSLAGLIYLCAGLSLLLLYYVWSPYHASSSLRNALNDANAAELDAVIDFPAVRASLKEQIETTLAPASPSDSSPGTTPSNALSMIEHSIDLYVTPKGIETLVNKTGEFSKDDLNQVISPDVAGKILLAITGQPVRNQGLSSFNDFVLQMDAAWLHLQFGGIGWKLKRVDLQPALLATGAAAASPLVAPVVDTYLERGNNKVKNNDWNGALADFTQILAIDPQSSAAYNDRGTARQFKGDLDGAIKDYSHALAIDPQMAAAYNGRGNAKAAKNDQDGAIADFTEAVRIDPTMAAAYDSRGNAKTAKEDLDGAIADFTQAITIDPTLASAYSDRGFARQANGNLDGAISDYTQALALKPKTAIAYYNRGLARQSQGNLEAAIVDYDRALAFDPKIAGAYYNRGNAKNALHDVDGAIADFTQAVTLNPKIALAYCNRGLARQFKGDLDGALADYTQALAIDPKIAIAYFNRGLIKQQKNDLDGAIADNSQALDLDPKNALAYYNRGFAKLAKGNLDGAMADLKQFCDLAPKDHYADDAHLYLWLIAKAQNVRTDPDQELSDALENNWNSPSDDLASKTAAFLLGRINETDYLAITAPDTKADPGQQCEAWYFAGMKRLLMGDKITAIDYFQKCVATRQTGQNQYLLAQAELQALQSPPPSPPPAPVPAPTPAPAPPKMP